MLSFWESYATTNNPVEQYHRTLKLENSSRATTVDMIKFLDQSRIGFLAKKSKFASITEASKRLKVHYNRIKRQGQLQARALLPIGGHELVTVKHRVPLQQDGNTGIAHGTQLTQAAAGAPRTDIDHQRTKKYQTRTKNQRNVNFTLTMSIST
ncbi:Hypothetical protein PHPALM_4682 [Phytophthora palmivora]|uniref:Uncharacterized protein n=1 Tax=Phytophthora palmivora TaxID=4796 RepID=A0A2P4YJ72_9STRA|nr:Hypothetical protein PHPALM_4682 [Phytophthora palmivora]